MSGGLGACGSGPAAAASCVLAGAIASKSEAGDAWVRLPPKLLQRAGRDRRFVAPPDGVDVAVRYEGRDRERPVYRAVILRTEDGVAEGP